MRQPEQNRPAAFPVALSYRRNRRADIQMSLAIRPLAINSLLGLTKGVPAAALAPANAHVMALGRVLQSPAIPSCGRR